MGVLSAGDHFWLCILLQLGPHRAQVTLSGGLDLRDIGIYVISGHQRDINFYAESGGSG